MKQQDKIAILSELDDALYKIDNASDELNDLEYDIGKLSSKIYRIQEKIKNLKHDLAYEHINNQEPFVNDTYVYNQSQLKLF